MVAQNVTVQKNNNVKRKTSTTNVQQTCNVKTN